MMAKNLHAVKVNIVNSQGRNFASFSFLKAITMMKEVVSSTELITNDIAETVISKFRTC